MTPIEDPEYAKVYKTFSLSAPIPGVDNRVVVHEARLPFPSGLRRLSNNSHDER